MNEKYSSTQMIALLAALFLLLALGVVMVPRLNQVGGFAVGPGSAVRVAPLAVEESFDYEQAADNLAARWLAMARFYEKEGLLTRDPFDYEQAADNLAARWLAMARFYEKEGLLTRDPFDYEQAADNLAARWLAMARFYEKEGLLTRDPFDSEQAADISAARWIAIGKGYERLGLLNEQHAAPSPPLPAAVVMGMAESLSGGDLDKLLTFWSDDANFYIFGLPPNGSELVRGQEALRAEFADEIANHQQLEVAIEKVRGNIITTREKTWHDFTRQIGVAPLEATGVYQIVDGKIANYAWTLTEESASRLKNALAELMPVEAGAPPAVEDPVSVLAITFADGTCHYDGPLALQVGEVQVTLEARDLDKDKYGLALFALSPGKDYVDLMASITRPNPPPWSELLLLASVGPGATRTVDVSVSEGPIYAVCMSDPPDIPIGNLGPFEIVP